MLSPAVWGLEKCCLIEFCLQSFCCTSGGSIQFLLLYVVQKWALSIFFGLLFSIPLDRHLGCFQLGLWVNLLWRFKCTSSVDLCLHLFGLYLETKLLGHRKCSLASLDTVKHTATSKVVASQHALDFSSPRMCITERVSSPWLLNRGSRCSL